jgi:hypothetical protein
MESEIRARLAALERGNQRLSRMIAVLLSLMVGGLLASCISGLRAQSPSAEVLTVSELRVVDQRGVVRVRIGGDLPDAIVQGKRTPRGDRAAGVLLYDTTAQERGGYVTFNRNGNIGLTLDSRYRQQAVFRTDSIGQTTLRLFRGNDVAELRVDQEGAQVNVIRKGEVVVQLPEITDPAATSTCSDLRELRTQHRAEVIMNACTLRMPAAACRKCLERP